MDATYSLSAPMASVAAPYQTTSSMPQAARRPAFGFPASQNASYTQRNMQQQQWPAQQQAPAMSRDPGMQNVFRARLQRNGSSSQLYQDAAAMQFDEDGCPSSSNSFTSMHQRSHSGAEQQQHQAQQLAASSSFWACSSQQQQQHLPPHPVHQQNRRTSFEGPGPAAPCMRPSMDVSAAAAAAAAAQAAASCRRSFDAGAPVSRRCNDPAASAAAAAAAAAAADRRRSVDVGPNALWTRSSLFSSSATTNCSSNAAAAAEAASAAAAAADRRRSLDVAAAAAAAPERRAAARYSIDIGSAAWARSSPYGGSSAAAAAGLPGMPSSRPMRTSPWGRDGMAAAAPMTAHGMHAVKQARQAASPHAQQQQHEMRQRAAVRSQPQWTNYAAVSAAPEPQIVRTNSSGSSGSASSSSSTYAASRQQQQLMQVACQSELFAGSGRDVHAGARPAVAADAVQQHKQHMAALQVIEDEIAYLSTLGQQLLTASKVAPQGSTAAAACEAAISKHEAAMAQALQARAALEAAAEQSLRGVGSMDLDLIEPELQGYYEAADACAAGTGTGTEEDEEEYYSAEGHAAMMRNAQQNSAMSLSSASMTEASLYQQETGLSREQQQQMLAAVQQQKMQQLRALQQMSADLHVMQNELAMLKMMPMSRQA